MSTILCYTYDADHHCPQCTADRFGLAVFQHGIGAAIDNEGNEVGAVFSWDEWQQFTGDRETLNCGTCGIELDSYEPEEWREAAESLAYDEGATYGKAAASWYFDGNTTRETYARVLQGIEDGDPRIYDTFPSEPLNGMWADEPRARDILQLVGTSEDDPGADDILAQYEDGYGVAVADEIERAARAALEG